MTVRGGAGHRAPLLLFVLFALCLVGLLRPVPVPDAWRGLCALVAVFLFPGLALGGILPRVRERGPWVRLALAVPGSLFLGAMAALGGALLGLAPLVLGAATLFCTFVLLLFGLERSSASPGGTEGPSASPGRWGLLVLVGSVGLALWSGAPTSATSDGPDHVTTVNNILRTGDPFPASGLVPFGEITVPDPRKGTYHVGLAVASELSGVPPYRLWPSVPAVVAPSWLALLGLVGLALGLCSGRAAVAMGLGAVFLGGYGTPWMTRIGYGAHMGYVTALAATWTFLEAVRTGRRSWIVATGVLGAVSGCIHPMAPFFLLVPAVGVLLGTGGDSRSRALRTLTLVVGLLLPVAAWRWSQLSGDPNPLHLQVMPVFGLAEGWSVLWPGELIRLLGGIGLLGVGLLPFLWRRFPAGAPRAWVLAAAFGGLGPVLIPGLFDLGARFTSSLPIKLVVLAPWIFVLPVAFAWTRWPARAGALLVGALVLWALPGGLSRFEPTRVAGYRPPALAEALAVLRAEPDTLVVVATPRVSALIASETQHDPITVYHQHGHPLDSHGLRRLVNLGILLAPQTRDGDRLDLLRRSGADRVLLVRDPRGGGDQDLAVGSDPALYPSRVAALEFSSWSYREGAGTDWGLWGMTTGSGFTQELLATAPPSPPVTASAPGRLAQPIPREEGEAEGVRLVAVEFPDPVRAGEPMDCVFWWSGEQVDRDPEALAAGWPVQAHVRLVRATAPASGSKLARHLRMHLDRPETLDRYRTPVQPFAGAWPSPGWPARGVVADTCRIHLPATLEAGEYRLSIRVLARNLFETIDLRDVLQEQDRWSGRTLARIQVLAAWGNDGT